ncbi:MAG: hypothetical protein R3354_03575, partial [Thiohalomonadales bacterium]|nr:hypothetical protein [Thiohalomonadales bacterium]
MFDSIVGESVIVGKCYRLIWGALLVMALVSSPSFFIWPVASWLDQQRLNQIAVFAALLPLMSWLASYSYPLGPDVRRLLWGVLGLGVVSATFSAYSYWPWVELAMFVGLFALTLAVFRLCAFWEKTADVAVWIIFGVVLVLLAQYLGSLLTVFLSHSPLIPNALFTGFDNPRWFGQFQSISLPVLALPVVSLNTPFQRKSAFLVLSLWWFATILDATRGTWFAMCCLLIFFSLFRSFRWWSLLQIKAAAVGVTLSLILIWVLVPGFGIVYQSQLQDRLTLDSSHRWEIWSYALKQIC